MQDQLGPPERADDAPEAIRSTLRSLQEMPAPYRLVWGVFALAFSVGFLRTAWSMVSSESDPIGWCFGALFEAVGVYFLTGSLVALAPRSAAVALFLGAWERLTWVTRVFAFTLVVSSISAIVWLSLVLWRQQ